MQVKCDLCEQIDQIEASSILAKRLLHQKVQSYLCGQCNERITLKTKQRHETGKFQLYKAKENNPNKQKQNGSNKQQKEKKVPKEKSSNQC